MSPNSLPSPDVLVQAKKPGEVTPFPFGPMRSGLLALPPPSVTYWRSRMRATNMNASMFFHPMSLASMGGVPADNSKKRKLSAAPEVCWDMVKKLSCPRGAACQWSHDVDPNDFIVEPAAKKPKQGSGIKGRTDEDRANAKEEYAKWQEERVEMGMDPEGKHCQSLDWWYAQTCLACLAECDLTTFKGHRKSVKHTAKYKEIGGLQLRPGILRPDPHLTNPLSAPDRGQFESATGFASARVLALGEQDYSFSLAIARLQQNETQEVRLVATSYLEAHDPSEPEVHVRDDGMRSTYQRKSLPSMEGALEKNISEIQSLGGVVLHGVDATDLLGTLLTQHPGGIYDVIVFPFPRASLRRGVDPMNPRLLRYFFRSVNDAALLAQGGVVELLLLRSQYADWDTACVAMEAGFELQRHTSLPEGFYQSREMSGKTWTPKDAEVYVFSKVWN
mmetsp:Transcript_80986/g.224009  ORF Transcript_80986/g.224009 Transcript_80986/m.224009 type:complete len:447 (-) Transcript_80986:191-1531(-)